MTDSFRSPDTTPDPKRSFSLGSATVTRQPKEIKRRRRLFLPFSMLVIVSLLVLAGVSLVIGVRFTQSFKFENRSISFFEGVKLIGSSLFGDQAELEGEDEGRINILLLGRAGETYPGRNLTDTVMVLSLDTKGKRAGLLSLPRDLFVPIPGTDSSTKLNSLYQIGLNEGEGVELLRESVSEITGLPLHYYAMIDFDGFEKTIDALGGIRVDVVRDIYDERYPGKNYSYETFEIKKGWQKLDGKTALKYARQRHGDPEGDFGRAKRQQQIIEAVRDRAWSLPTFLNPFTLSAFLESLGESVTTDIAPEEIGRFIELARTIDTHTMATIVVDAWKADSLLRTSHIEASTGRVFVLVPRSGSWNELERLALHIFDEEQSEEKMKRVEEERAAVLIVTAPTKRQTAEALRQDIRATWPTLAADIRTVSALEKESETAIIHDESGLQKPFTLDSLVARYSLTFARLPQTLTTLDRDNYDLVLVYTKREVPGLHEPAAPERDTDTLPYDFQEPLPPQKNVRP